MEITDRRVATVHYTLTVDDGTLVHSSSPIPPKARSLPRC